jgi:hypothetical protein
MKHFCGERESGIRISETSRPLDPEGGPPIARVKNYFVLADLDAHIAAYVAWESAEIDVERESVCRCGHKAKAGGVGPVAAEAEQTSRHGYR